jgi:hypothetical protein
MLNDRSSTTPLIEAFNRKGGTTGTDVFRITGTMLFIWANRRAGISARLVSYYINARSGQNQRSNRDAGTGFYNIN